MSSLFPAALLDAGEDAAGESAAAGGAEPPVVVLPGGLPLPPAARGPGVEVLQPIAPHAPRCTWKLCCGGRGCWSAPTTTL